MYSTLKAIWRPRRGDNLSLELAMFNPKIISLIITLFFRVVSFFRATPNRWTLIKKWEGEGGKRLVDRIVDSTAWICMCFSAVVVEVERGASVKVAHGFMDLAEATGSPATSRATSSPHTHTHSKEQRRWKGSARVGVKYGARCSMPAVLSQAGMVPARLLMVAGG